MHIANTLLIPPIVWLAYQLYVIFVRPRFGMLSKVPGPPRESAIFGTVAGAFGKGIAETIREWKSAWGETFVVDEMFGAKAIVTTDHRAITHVYFTRAFDYGHTPQVKRLLAGAFGKGILIADGDDHKNQRRVLSPAFSTQHINALVPDFRGIALTLASVWSEMITSSGSPSIELNVHDWFSRLTFDAIGRGGFGHEFHTLSPSKELPEDALSAAFRTVFSYMHGEPLAILESFFPILTYLPTQRRKIVKTSDDYVHDQIRELVQERKVRESEAGEGDVKKGDVKGKDLLSLLVRANMASDLKASERLSDQNVVEQVALFMAAGHETTSNALAFAAWRLAMNPEQQDRLRAELLTCPQLDPSAPAEECTYPVLQEMKFLDAVVNETLRLHPAGGMNGRTALVDDIIPFSAPITLTTGEVVTSLPVRAGDKLMVPMPNEDPDVWGPDASEFRAERWLDLPEKAEQQMGWNHLGTFGYGAKNCLGLRFAALELKAVIATVVRNFVLSPAPRSKDVIKRSKIVTKPYLRDDDSGPQLPLLISRYQGPSQPTQ